MDTTTNDAAEQDAADHRRSGGLPLWRSRGGGIALCGRLLIPVREAWEMLGVGNTKGYDLINTGVLIARKLGPRTMIEAESLRSYAASLPMLPARRAAPSEAAQDAVASVPAQTEPVPARGCARGRRARQP